MNTSHSFLSVISRHLVILILVLVVVDKSASAYPTGSISCSDIGDFAAAVVVGKEDGQTMEEALAKVDKRAVGYAIEHKNLTQIVRVIYTEPLGQESLRIRR